MSAANELQAPAYTALAARELRLHRLGHVQAVATWDRMTFMPEEGREARAAAQLELSGVIQELRDDPAYDAHFARASAEPLSAPKQRNLELMRREHRLARAVPKDLANRLETAAQSASAVWHSARERNDWNAFAAPLEPLVAAVREQAQRLGEALGIAPYDALIDQHEPGVRHAHISTLFADVSSWLPDLVARAIERQRDAGVIEPKGPFPLDAQRALCERVMAAMGFDFGRGRLDVSAHPFTGGVPEDVRLTTRFKDSTFLPALLATLHETGHACYQQNLPRQWLGQPVAGPHSASLHEGQALTFERQLAPTPAFARWLAPLLAEAFGDDEAFDPANLVRLMTRVRPGRIRVEADELTYPAHVILRFEIEHALVSAAIEVADVPAWWDERMAKLLGIDTRGDHACGALQDVHWSQGMFGYFPAYLLGAMVAAQCMERLRADTPDLDDQVGRGRPRVVFDWLAERIWRHGAMDDLDERMAAATGRALDAAALRRHLERRYA